MDLQCIVVEHTLSCFMPVNVDCPVDGGKNMFVYGSGSGVPYT